MEVRREVVNSPPPFAWMVHPHGNESLLVHRVLALCYSSFSCPLLACKCFINICKYCNDKTFDFVLKFRLTKRLEERREEKRKEEEQVKKCKNPCRLGFFFNINI